MSTIDPGSITSAAGIPPQGAGFAGITPGQVEVYSGTLAGDIDAQPAAKELLGTALDTGTDVNADYIYKQLAKLYNDDLPVFQSASGNNVKALVFVSGSAQGGYGAFHFPGTQADFDRIVVDSLNVSGNYSSGSGLASAMAPLKKSKTPHLLPMFRGADDLNGVLHAGDPRLHGAKPDAIKNALTFAAQSIAALSAAIETRNMSAIPKRPVPMAHHSPKAEGAELTRRLILANQAVIGLVDAAVAASAGRQYLSTALFAAELIESFEMKTGKADSGKTDGEAVSRVVAFKLAPEIALVPGFNSGVTQQWWKDGHPDYVNDNSQTDQSTDGNAAGVMFLLFLTDYLGVAMDQILGSMPTAGGAPLGQTYVALLKDHPELGLDKVVGGQTGAAAFQKMVSLLQNTQNPDGSLNLPANGNPYPSMQGAKQGGLFAAGTAPGTAPVVSSGAVAQDAQAALQMETQVEQQVAALKAVLQQIRGEASGSTPPPAVIRAQRRAALFAAAAKEKDTAFAYKPALPGSVVTNLEQRVASFRAPQYDQTLQTEFWKHVYNETPGSGVNTDRLQVISGTNQTPVAVQITGTIQDIKPEPDGDFHIRFRPDDPNFPTNQNSAEPPLEIEIIYAALPVTQADAKPAEKGYTNPFDVSKLVAGTRIQAAGPLIYDRAHGVVDGAGNVQYGLEIHPLTGVTVLTAGSSTPGPAAPGGPGGPVAPTGPAAPGGPGPGGPGGPVSPTATQLNSDLAAAVSQAGTLGQTMQNLTALLQKMQGEAPTS